MAEGKKTPLDTGLVNLVASGLLETIRSVTPASWFGPGQPLPPIAPKDQNIRQYDYQFGINLQTQPRATESGISYEQLRALADGYDVLRCVIETRKDQAVKAPWTFRLRREPGESVEKQRKRTVKDPRIKQLNEIFRYPDTERDWKTWFRAFLEEVFVIDALSLAPKYNNDGAIYGLDVIDGATINRKVTLDGRTPPAPEVAYQQILHGVPAKDLTTRELIYRPRNYRANRLYGYSPVEQIVLTINMALRRQQTQIGFFTEGNIPEAIGQVPDGWTPEDIKNLQQQFDILAGNIAKKSRIRFIPKMDGLLFPKEKMLADKFDEWLARIVCFAFSISPQAFVQQMNRATAETAQDTAKDEGVVPTLDFASGVLTFFADRYVKTTDIEHAFIDEQESDRLKQATIDKIYASYGKQQVDEQRERDGEEPLGLAPVMMGATGPIPLAPFMKGGPMADGLPEHAKSPEDLDNEKKAGAEDAHSKTLEIMAAKDSTPAEKLLKAKKKNYY